MPTKSEAQRIPTARTPNQPRIVPRPHPILTFDAFLLGRKEPDPVMNKIVPEDYLDFFVLNDLCFPDLLVKRLLGADREEPLLSLLAHELRARAMHARQSGVRDRAARAEALAHA